MEKEKIIKIVAIGDGAVGKTCLFIRYALRHFPGEYIPTIFDNYEKQMTANEVEVKLHLWDTAGRYDYDRIRPLSYPNTDVFFIIFSVINRSSFERVKSRWEEEVQQYCPKTPIMLIGSKLDLREDEETLERLKEKKLVPVSYEEGLSMAQNIGAISYKEVSSLTGQGVDEAFLSAIQYILTPKQKKTTKWTFSLKTLLKKFKITN